MEITPFKGVYIIIYRAHACRRKLDGPYEKRQENKHETEPRRPHTPRPLHLVWNNLKFLSLSLSIFLSFCHTHTHTHWCIIYNNLAAKGSYNLSCLPFWLVVCVLSLDMIWPFSLCQPKLKRDFCFVSLTYKMETAGTRGREELNTEADNHKWRICICKKRKKEGKKKDCVTMIHSPTTSYSVAV